MIEVKQLVKWFGPTLAVDHLNFTIEAGQVVGLLGPNGAGKSTTIRMLTGFLPPTAGEVTLAGFNATTQSRSVRQRIGYLPENTPLYTEMRVEEYLHYRGKLHGMPRKKRRERIEVVVARCGLQPVRQRVIGALSKGNRQRVGLAQALLHDPPVLILDEPTAGLDPNQIQEVRRLLAELRGHHTVLISSHILPEIEKTADRVMIIAKGRIVADDSVERLRRRVAGDSELVLEVRTSKQTLEMLLRKVVGEERTIRVEDDRGWSRAVIATQGEDLRETIGKAISTNGWTVREMQFRRASLEEYFVQVTAEGY